MADRSEQFRRLQRSSNRSQSHLAVTIGSRYCRRHPLHSPAWLFYGRALAETRRYADARAALLQGLACAPAERQVAFYAQLGHLEVLAGQFEAAESWYRKAFTAAPADATERLYLAELHYLQGNLAEAEAAIRPVTEAQNESLGEAFHLLGEILGSQGRYDASLDAFKRAAEASPACRKHARRVRELVRVIRRRGPPRAL